MGENFPQPTNQATPSKKERKVGKAICLDLSAADPPPTPPLFLLAFCEGGGGRAVGASGGKDADTTGGTFAEKRGRGGGDDVKEEKGRRPPQRISCSPNRSLPSPFTTSAKGEYCCRFGIRQCRNHIPRSALVNTIRNWANPIPRLG